MDLNVTTNNCLHTMLKTLQKIRNSSGKTANVTPHMWLNVNNFMHHFGSISHPNMSITSSLYSLLVGRQEGHLALKSLVLVI